MENDRTVLLVTPVYNDWASFSHLIADVQKTFNGQGVVFDVLVVDDASTIEPSTDLQNCVAGRIVRSVTVLRSRANLGHQFAIAIGLRYAAENCSFDAILVMDADGEDRPEDAARMIETWRAKDDAIIVGLRAKRSESVTFKFFYFLYQTVFRVLTGRSIAFGNFSIIPKALLLAVVDRPELPHHYAATILRSRLPLVALDTTRGRRYVGQSHMNTPSLVFHAVAAFSVFSDVLFSRFLIASASIATLCAIGIVIVTYMRLFTTLAFPNWATTVIAFLALLASQAILLVLSSAFQLLMGRSSMLMTSLETSRMVARVRSFGSVTQAPAQKPSHQ
jgi:polyisoprenyl-phosphate glycosyltransferase